MKERKEKTGKRRKQEWHETRIKHPPQMLDADLSLLFLRYVTSAGALQPTAIATSSLGWCQILMNSSHWRPYKNELPIPMVTHWEETLRGASWTQPFCAASSTLGAVGQVFWDSVVYCDCKPGFSTSSEASTGESLETRSWESLQATHNLNCGAWIGDNWENGS